MGKTTVVGQFPPNAFGLYDMHGNVLEWCQDNYHKNYENAPKDSSPWFPGRISVKVMRCGAWNYDLRNCRSAYRRNVSRNDHNNDLGFRVVCVTP